ncbi:ACP S-malonyltransferase [Lacticaseibacillus camelliae]|uniref:[acyl-carrier-protein] S-malonyltransferase n=1 Tax=Lacticaseibacillus camelliae DSM 22697 = JCM 13995 TaxID=1423730 RepID=A0A0R2F1T4_9LACO|nr:acyltransferase domain-containing protein [Lacticaseibacillus camelliae]KRN22513.1 acyl transferase region [Lacticaseibacillus camelliae DSM 22697 = JCM 13995]
MNSLWIFPGQGGQHAGMLADVDADLRSHVADLLGMKLLDTDIAYQDSVQLQVGIELLQVAQVDAMFKAGLKPHLVAGHSLGVFAAAYAIGSLEKDDLFRVVKRRAELMQGAYPTGYGMGVVVGLSRDAVEKLVAQVHSTAHPVYASNQNAEDQTALSGELTAIDEVVALAKQNGAVLARRLKVPVPSHSPLMTKVSTQLAAAMADVELKKPAGIYLANYSGRAVRQTPPMREDLTSNLKHPVYFEAMMGVAHDYQPDSIVNFSPGRPFRKALGQKFGDLHQISLDQMSVSDAAFLLNKWERGSY